MKVYCGTPCSPASCLVVDGACSNYHSDAGRQ
jgi:hypothetical protein